MPDILLIDDDERLSDLLSRYLQPFQLNVHSALHPDDGLALLDSRSFDLVILDVMLPDKDGFEVCREIRKQSNIPIIMLTAKHDTQSKVRGFKIGVDDYVTKPFDFDS